MNEMNEEKTIVEVKLSKEALMDLLVDTTDLNKKDIKILKKRLRRKYNGK